MSHQHLISFFPGLQSVSPKLPNIELSHSKLNTQKKQNEKDLETISRYNVYGDNIFLLEMSGSFIVSFFKKRKKETQQKL